MKNPSPYCKRSHGSPNGAAPSYPVPNCTICGQTQLTNFDWYCPNCFRCLKCQKIVFSKVKDGVEPEIPNTILINRWSRKGERCRRPPQFTHSKQLCRLYSLGHREPYIKDYVKGVVLKGDDVPDLLNGNLDLINK